MYLRMASNCVVKEATCRVSSAMASGGGGGEPMEGGRNHNESTNDTAQFYKD
jgi:hypothetical protein